MIAAGAASVENGAKFYVYDLKAPPSMYIVHVYVICGESSCVCPHVHVHVLVHHVYVAVLYFIGVHRYSAQGSTQRSEHQDDVGDDQADDDDSGAAQNSRPVANRRQPDQDQEQANWCVRIGCVHVL